ncbi:MAG: L,D-transpeptidase family protein [Thermodesulfobacteriota bacterium]|nr:L,D-transpeptidase family protein [Thermodesulfobacteriota bacterium]
MDQVVNKAKALLFLVISLFFLLFIFGWVWKVNSQEIRFKKGEITSLEIDSQTVVVEVPFGSQYYTVGGSLSSTTILKKRAGEKACLRDFHAGDVVRVGWRKTETGHRIELLELITPAKDLQAKRIAPHLRDPTLIGTPQLHIIKKKETLLDIARQYGLGFNELQDLYHYLDPWIPPEGMQLIIPSQWILPEGEKNGIVINVAECRLYFFLRKQGIVKTYPIGIGDTKWPTPIGFFTVGKKRIHPTWYIPPSLQGKYGIKRIPPGPENPLGDYWIGLKGTMYGIHGTDIPWSVGRLVTHGCIRMYPEDIRELFKMIRPGSRVRIMYEPVKIGFLSGNIYVEIHRDIYHKIGRFTAYGHELLRKKGIAERVDMERFQQALERQDGMPIDVTRGVL